MKVFILTLGCPKNQVDSQKIAGQLMESGHQVVPEPQDADFILVNTCAFLADAEQEAREHIEKMSKFAAVGVIGCLPARRPEQKRIIGQAPAKAQDIIELSDKISWDPNTGIRLLSAEPHAFVKISEGCSRACSFCVIPNIRGKNRSRSVESVVAEAEILLAAGKRELVLIAQDTSQFGWDTGESLARLLRQLDRLQHDFWIRLMYLHPAGVDRELAQTLGSMQHLVPYVHMPVQHISQRVLRAMSRDGGRNAVLKAIELLRNALESAFFRTELMVGFPGETPGDFSELLELMNSGVFQRVALFKFSREPGSRAYDMQQLDQDIINERFEQALSVAMGVHSAAQNSLVGETVELLVEEPGLGRSEYDAPEVDFRVKLPEHWRPGHFREARVVRVDQDLDLVVE